MLAGDLPVEIEFVLEQPQADALIDLLKTGNLNLYFVNMPVETSVVGDI